MGGSRRWRGHRYEDSTTKIINITNEANLHINKEREGRTGRKERAGGEEKEKRAERSESGVEREVKAAKTH